MKNRRSLMTEATFDEKRGQWKNTTAWRIGMDRSIDRFRGILQRATPGIGQQLFLLGSASSEIPNP